MMVLGGLRRRDFLRLRHHGAIARSKAFLLRAHAGGMDAQGACQETGRLGFTVTRRVGNAVERNRIRRRLREAVRTSGADWLRPGHDYALIARRDVLSLPFARLVRDLDRALRNVHKALDGALDGGPDGVTDPARVGSTRRRRSSRKDGCP